jgi:hypothetical protein
MRTRKLPAHDGELVPEHDDLELLRGRSRRRLGEGTSAVTVIPTNKNPPVSGSSKPLIRAKPLAASNLRIVRAAWTWHRLRAALL